MSLKIGKVTLGNRPVVCGVLQEVPSASTLGKLQKIGVRLVEFRADQLKPNEVIPALACIKKAKFSILLTIRTKKEGGAWKFSEEERLKVFKYLLPSVDAVDIELQSKICAQVIRLAHSKKKKAIVSSHDFKKTPSISTINSYLKRAKKLKADIFKIAANAKSKYDLDTMTNFTLAGRDQNLITISMGKLGASSRILLPLFGSLITYGHVGRESAPGQFPVEKLANVFKFPR